MAELRWTIPDEEYLRYIFAFAALYGYQTIVPDRDGGPPVPNPETAPDFVHRMVAADWNEKIVQFELNQTRSQVPPPASPRIQKGGK